MSQRLYRVRVERTHEVVVIADSEGEAEHIAYKAVDEDDGGLGPETLITDAIELNDVRQVPHGWDKEALPYGDNRDGEKTIAEILSVKS